MAVRGFGNKTTLKRRYAATSRRDQVEWMLCPRFRVADTTGGCAVQCSVHRKSSAQKRHLRDEYDTFTDTNITLSRSYLVFGILDASLGIMYCPISQMRCVHSVSFGRPIGARVSPSVVNRSKVVATALEEIDPNTGLPFENSSTRTVKPR